MKILVSGGKGQVGSEFPGLDLPEGIEVITLGSADLDITDSKSIDVAFDAQGPDLLINAAAYTSVDQAESESVQAYAVNERGVALLAEACSAADIPMFHISTDYVFDGTKKSAYVENDSVNPLSVYGKSKEAGERALRSRLAKHIVLRTSWVFGPHGANFVNTILRLARERDQLRVVADQIGGPSSATSIAEVLLRLASQFKQTGNLAWGTYHYCQKPYVNWYQFAQAITQYAMEIGLLDRRVEIVPISSSEFSSIASRPVNSCLDTSKTIEKFSIQEIDWNYHLRDHIQAMGRV